MNARPLNLLRYPRRMHPILPGQWRDLLGAALAGVLMGCGGCLWLDMDGEQLLQSRTHLQTQAMAWRAQQARQRELQDQARLQSAWRQRAQAWQGQRRRLAQLHAALNALTSETGLRVERWQGDGRKLQLQAWLPQTGSVPTILSGLSGAWGSGWTLQSMGDRTDGGVQVMLQAAWLADTADDAQTQQ